MVGKRIDNYQLHIINRSVLDPIKGCWIWQGSKEQNGYGHIRYKGKATEMAHRVSYEAYKGAIPKGLLVMHTCDVPSCVNPAHLVVGTIADNVADKMTKGRWRVK